LEWTKRAANRRPPSTSATRAAIDESGKFSITVCHLPPGTSKWTKNEHRLFSFITINWRGKPLRSYRAIIQLIAASIARPKGIVTGPAPSI
jgi:Rhodopirellula transposase DDE domain